MGKLIEKRGFRIILNAALNLILLIVLIVFALSLKDFNVDNITTLSIALSIIVPLFNVILYSLFDVRNYDASNSKLAAGFSALIYFVLWAFYALLVIVMSLMLGMEIKASFNSTSFKFFVLYGFVLMPLGIYFVQWTLDYISYGRKKFVQARKKYAPFMPTISIVVAFVIGGVISIINHKSETVIGLVTFIPSLGALVLFLLTALKKWRNRGVKASLRNDTGSSSSSYTTVEFNPSSNREKGKESDFISAINRGIGKYYRESDGNVEIVIDNIDARIEFSTIAIGGNVKFIVSQSTASDPNTAARETKEYSQRLLKDACDKLTNKAISSINSYRNNYEGFDKSWKVDCSRMHIN